MKGILRVFPRSNSFTPTDDLAFVGDPPLFRLPADEVHVSCTFTWDIMEAERLCTAWAQYYPCVELGGPAITPSNADFLPGRYVRDGVTFTTRGCNGACPWCLVPGREGRLQELANFAPGWIVQDNNLLQASRGHLARVFEMLRSQRHAVTFSGGLDACLLSDKVADEIRGLRIDQVFLAADTPGSVHYIERAMKHLQLPGRRWRVRVYALLGYDGETIDRATERLEAIWAIGAMPFAQLYQPPDRWIDYSAEWRTLAREWSRPAIMQGMHKGEVQRDYVFGLPSVREGEGGFHRASMGRHCTGTGDLCTARGSRCMLDGLQRTGG